MRTPNVVIFQILSVRDILKNNPGQQPGVIAMNMKLYAD